MKSVFEMPQIYKKLDKSDIPYAFLSYYNELTIGQLDDTQMDHLLSDISIAIQNLDYSNEDLWMVAWLTYIAFEAKFYNMPALEALAKKEINYIEDTAINDLMQLFFVCQISLCEYTGGDLLFFTTRLYNAIHQIDNHQTFEELPNDFKTQVAKKVLSKIGPISPRQRFFINNPFFDKKAPIKDLIDMMAFRTDESDKHLYAEKFKSFFLVNNDVASIAIDIIFDCIMKKKEETSVNDDRSCVP